MSTEYKIHVYEPSRGRWLFVMDSPEWFDEGSSVHSYDEGLIVAGANSTRHGNKVALINVIDFSTKSLPSLPQHTRASSVLYYEQYVYVIGGTVYSDNGWIKSNNMYRWSSVASDKNFWELIGLLKHAVSRPLLFGMDSCVYVVGGVDDTNSSCLHTQVYNVNTIEWIPHPEVKVTCDNIRNGGVVDDDKLIITTPNSSVILDKDDPCWEMKRYKKKGDEINAFSTSQRNTIVSCVFDQRKCTLQTYDYTSNRWEKDDITLLGNIRPYYFHVI